MTVYNVTNVSQLTNAWTSADTNGDIIFIKAGDYNYTAETFGRVPTPSQVNGLHRNIQVIGYKDSYNASNATSDLDDIDEWWDESSSEMIFQASSGIYDFPRIRTSNTAIGPLIRMGTGWTGRNLYLRRDVNGPNDNIREVIRVNSGFNHQTFINCRFEHNGNRGQDILVNFNDFATAAFYACEFYSSSSSTVGTFPSSIRLDDNSIISLINCVMRGSGSDRNLVRSCGSVYAYKSVFRNGNNGVFVVNDTGSNHDLNNVCLLNCTFRGQNIATIRNFHNTSGSHTYYYVNNIAFDANRVISSETTSRPIFMLNTRRIEITNSDINFTANDKDIYPIAGGSSSEFVDSNNFDFRLDPSAQSIGILPLNGNIGALRVEPMILIQPVGFGSIRHGH